MDNLSKRLATLSPEKRILLERRLRMQENKISKQPIVLPKSVEHPPLSFAQQRLWFLELLEPEHAFYNLPLTIQFAGLLDSEILEKSINEIVRRHESLRTTFISENGEPVQVIAPELKLTLQIIDLTVLPPAEIQTELGKQVMREVMRPFDLQHGPLFRCFLFKTSGDNYLLLLLMHHIVSDGWSLEVIKSELNAAYEAFAAGKKSPLPDLPRQYGDFAVWQREYLQGETLERLLSYWKLKLKDMPMLLELPTDFVRPHIQNFNGSFYSFPYPKAPYDKLRKISQKQDATLFMTLLAVFKILLFRFSGISDMVIGSPVANRNRIEFENLIGFFVNTLVLRTSLSADLTFREVLSLVKETTLEAIGHQELPFERLVEELQPNRTLSHNPLFQVMFGLQNTETQKADRNSPIQFVNGISKFDLTLNLTETGEGLSGVWEFNSELFEPQTIESLAETFGNLLAAAAENPDCKISELPLLSREKRQELIESAATKGSAPPAMLIHKWFELQARNTPDAPAIAFGGRELTYRELDTRANQLANSLRENCVKTDTLIGLSMDRSLEFPVAMLGILKAGAAFVPLDPEYPKERLKFILKDTAISVLLTQSHLTERFESFEGETRCLDIDWSELDSHSIEAPFFDISPDNLAYVIYTSGSTGRPKGVMVSHRNLCYAAQAQVEVFGLPPKSRVLQFGSLSFDTSIYDLIMVIGSGGTLCLAPQEEIMPGPPLAQTLRDLNINAITIPPSSLSVVPEEDLPDLKLLICGGEALSRELVERWRKDKRLFNAYGPTETTIWATVSECTDGETTPPIGRPIPNLQAFVLDSRLEPVPKNWSGEIYLGGAGVARGYLNRSDLTAERYLPNPFGKERSERFYKTGDRGKLLQNGDIQFLKRLDDQLKLRGYRIELGEIEAVLSEHPRVTECAVVAKKTPTNETRLAAYVVCPKKNAPDRAKLLAYLRQRLPEFMIPSSLNFIDVLPLNISGKLDRVRLSKWTDDEVTTVKEWIAPQTNIEEKVAEIFQEVLETSKIGSNDNFFEMGGHSLLGTKVITRINDSFGISMPLRMLFEFPTIAELARSVEQHQSGEFETAQPVINRAERRAVAVPAIDYSDS